MNCVEDQQVSERINLLNSTSTEDLETKDLIAYSGEIFTFLHQFRFRLSKTDHLRLKRFDIILCSLTMCAAASEVRPM
jgi:hypothetical protein